MGTSPTHGTPILDVPPPVRRRAGNRRRVLLVGDRTLASLDSTWDVVVAPNGNALPGVLSDEPFHAAAIDLRAAGRDVVAAIADVQPLAARIVVCDAEPHGQLYGLLPEATQFVRRSADPSVLRRQLVRATASEPYTVEARLARRIARASIPALPGTHAALRRELGDPNTNVQRVADVLERDIGLAARVLEHVNSALYARPRPISQLSQAVSLLGLRAVRDLALTAEVYAAFADTRPVRGVNVQALYSRSLEIGSMARWIATGTPAADDAFLAGLLHNVGQIALLARIPDVYASILDESADTGRPIHELETSELGVTSRQIGAWLLRVWGMPDPVVEAVCFYDAPALVDHTAFAAVDALHVASHLWEAGETGSQQAEGLDQLHMAQIGMAKKLQYWVNDALGRAPKWAKD